ncbi:hypothetical protein GF342_04850 [Candidatus Woesearchaeota archaeon]|nr:hypothetical protein [Candidatus Woesearchaeota archaeon]
MRWSDIVKWATVDIAPLPKVAVRPRRQSVTDWINLDRQVTVFVPDLPRSTKCRNKWRCYLFSWIFDARVEKKRPHPHDEIVKHLLPQIESILGNKPKKREKRYWEEWVEKP